jgi:hypothetical protein
MWKILMALVFLGPGAHHATAQAPLPVPVPWYAPPAAARAELERAGFQRRANALAYGGSAPGAAAEFRGRRIVADTAASTHTRESGGVTESVFLRSRGGQTVQLVYSTVGDSTALQAKLDAVAAGQAGRSGAAASQGSQRVWMMEGGRRLSVPTRPFRLPDGATYQFIVVYSRP